MPCWIADFGTLGDVVAKTTIQLARVPRVGSASVAEIKAKLNARGLSLRELGGGALPPQNWRRDMTTDDDELLRASSWRIRRANSRE